jgi:hypothetical protein
MHKSLEGSERFGDPDSPRGARSVVEAIQDQWAIVAAVVVLAVGLIVWLYANR